MRRFLIILCFFSLIISKSYATGPAKSALKTVHRTSIQIDTQKIDVRHLDSAALQKYSKDPDFNYTVEKTEQISLWDRFWRWFWNWIERLLAKIPGGKHSAAIFKYILMAAFAVLVIWLILRLLKINLLQLFKKKKKEDSIPYTEYLENIHEINFDDAVENALADKNYRLAVRLLYLRCLKQLNDAQLISWRIEKTNFTYLNELEDPDYKKQFGQLTTRFEYVWYGDFPVDGQVFQNINTMFQDFKRRLP
jgi:Domain of unknown function (DUF4129)